ncbi:MAG: hypothetical protein IKC09_09105 [Oscillospiraceae bacterium]|nr:hypothetical protein [Oscillospiraceae bacterium]
MADIQALRELLATEYGIRSDKDLDEALSRMKKIDIGVFASPERKDRRKDEQHNSTAQKASQTQKTQPQVRGIGFGYPAGNDSTDRQVLRTG